MRVSEYDVYVCIVSLRGCVCVCFLAYASVCICIDISVCVREVHRSVNHYQPYTHAFSVKFLSLNFYFCA